MNTLDPALLEGDKRRCKAEERIEEGVDKLCHKQSTAALALEVTEEGVHLLLHKGLVSSAAIC
jgi:hypothetical protein